MATQTLVLLLSLAAAGGERVLDAFDYADQQTARNAWVDSAETPEVETVDSDGGRQLLFQAPFASRGRMVRTVIDRDLDLDLSAVGEFTLDIAVEHPQAVAQVSLYFRSGDGWYAAAAGLVSEGWQTLRFSKASFNIEDRPTGWHSIDGIRISCWRGQDVNSAVGLRKLAARWNDVALVIPSAAAHRGDSELQSSLKQAQQVGLMLAELGLGSDAIEDTAIAGGALGNRSVAILAHNPGLPGEAVEALVRFVDDGGKVFACYGLPAALGRALGFDDFQYYRPSRREELSEIRFDTGDLPGLPDAVRQSSWNITTAEPSGHNARVIGRWFDDAGQPTNRAALLLSDRGVYMSHIILPEDRGGKKQMLAALLGKLSPPLWETMARAELRQAGRVGHVRDAADLLGVLKASTNERALGRYQAGTDALRTAEKRLAEGAYPESVELARESHGLLVEAYLTSQPSKTPEGRAWWNHSGTGPYPGDWERTARELAENGFNMVIPNMLWGGRAHYASDVLPRSRTFQQHGDQIAQCVAACKKHGLEVHVWKVNYNLSGAPPEFVEMIRRQGRGQMDAAGGSHDWLCPSHPANFKLELESMLEVVRNYDVDGIHFDYIRYPGGDTCFCDGCRQRFEADSGQKVANWPADCHKGELHDVYYDWRCDQITALVEAVSRQAREIRPTVKISAAVFGAYPDCRWSVGQDWQKWVKAGYLDFLCPMDYTESDLAFSNLVENQLRLVDGRIPVYPGIGATATRISLTPDRVAGQIHHARRLGAAGFTIFNLSAGTAEEILPGVALGATSQRATPPHRE